MLFYYSLFEVIIFYNAAQEYIRENYDFECQECKSKGAILKSMEISISSLECKWCPKNIQESIYKKMDATMKLIKAAGVGGKPGRAAHPADLKVDGNLLPVGYSINKVPRFFHITKGWYDAADYARHCKTFRENDVIIGYYSKSKSGLRVSFKVRKPVHQQVETKDTRKIEKGTNCASKSKTELVEILERLDTKISDNMSINELCKTLNYRLIQLEIIERKNPNSNIKYFYHYWECQPQT